MVDDDPLRRDAEQARELPLEADRDVAEPDGTMARVEQRARHDPDRIREVDDPGAVGGAVPERGLRSRARPARCAAPSRTARAGRLLPDAAARSGRVSSVSRAAWPPTRICTSTKSAPSTARSRSPVSSSPPRKPARSSIRPASAPTTSSRSASMSCSVSSSTRARRQARHELRRVRRARADDGDLHPFTPVSVTPSTNAFCARRKSAITGAITISVAAMVSGHCT